MRRKILPGLTLTVIVLLALVLNVQAADLKTPAKDSRLAEILERGKLIVGMEIGYYPFEYLDHKGQPVGIDVDLARRAATELGVELVIRDLDWEKLIPALQAGKIDCIISAMTRTLKRSTLVGFTDPYYETGLCALVSNKRASNVDKIKELNKSGRIVTVIAGTAADPVSQEFFPKAKIVKLDREIECVKQVVKGRADAFIFDQISVWKRQKEYSQKTHAILEPFTHEFFCIAAPIEDQVLINILNYYLHDIKNSRFYDRIFGEYF